MKNQDYIWLIDDDATDQFILEKCAKKIGCKYSTFTFVDEAINQLKLMANEAEFIPDYILIDINMPVLSGWDFIEKYQQISHRLSKIPSLYIISYSILKEDIDRAKNESLIAGFINKPITDNSLLQVINHSK